MSLFNVLALLLILAALASYLNDRYLRLPTTVGLMLMSVAGSLLLVVAEHFGLPLKAAVQMGGHANSNASITIAPRCFSLSRS